MPPKTPPMGSSPAVTPGQNQGLMMAGMQKVGTALKMLTEALADYGATSEEGQTIAKIITMAGKLAKPGSVSASGEANQLQKAQFQNAQNGQMLQMLKQQQQPPQGGAPGGAPGIATPPKMM
jgi:hypothetical protein